MVRKSLIRFDKQVLIQELIEEINLCQNTHSVNFSQPKYSAFNIISVSRLCGLST